MAHVKDIQADTEALSDEDFTRLREWFIGKNAAEKDTAEDENVKQR